MKSTQFKHAIEYYRLFPYEEHIILSRELFNLPVHKRSVYWEKQISPRYVEKNYKLMIKERNQFAKNKGFVDYIDFTLNRFDIPKTDYERFLREISQIIKCCNMHLPALAIRPEWLENPFSIPCYICEIANFPYKSTKEVLELIKSMFPQIARYNIHIVEGRESSTIYSQQNSKKIKITLRSDLNYRHKILDLIHELCHVLYYSENIFSTAYMRESEASKIELNLLKDLSIEIYNAMFGEYLLTIRRSLFEIDMYKNQNQNLSILYSKTFNKCYIKAKQIDNPLFVLDEYITLKPLVTLPHSVSIANILLSEPSI